jgi:hypothetical protein
MDCYVPLTCYLTLYVQMVFNSTGVRAMKHLLARTCVFSLAVTASLLAVAQTAEVAFTVSGFTWDYREERGRKSGHPKL